MTTEEKSPFSQVCVWPATIVGLEKKDDFEKFMLDEYHIRVKYLEEIKTLPSKGDPKSGGRNDVIFVIHSEDIGKFAIPRLAMNPPVRWIEDVLGNEKRRKDASIYPESVRKYLTWDYGLDEEEKVTQEQVSEFLDRLRESGVTNMFGARPYVQKEFPSLDKKQASKMVQHWMEHFGEDEE